MTGTTSYNWPDGRRRETLPIDQRLEEILGLLEHHQVVVVQAETGAGKTTRIPQAVILADPRARVTMTQTRRNAIRWNGKRIASELGCQPGGLIGWRLFGEEPMVSKETRLTLVIDQALANKVRRDGRLPKGLIVVDEAHERSVSTDLLLGLIKEGLATSPETKVLVTSATIDTEKFSRYFAIDSKPTPVVSVPGRCFPVSTEITRLESYEHHSQAAARAAGVAMERFLKGELLTPTQDGTDTQTVSKGTVLVLLPGKEDIRNVVDSLRWQARKLQELDKSPESELGRIEVTSCHGESTPDEQDQIQRPVPTGTLRFVCATEVVRTSVTVRETVGVVDSLELKRLVTDGKGIGHLTKVTISKAEADQAKGRAGRTAPGFYMPVSFESEFEGLAPYPTPAILREPTTHVALQVAAVGRSVRTFPFLDAPAPDKVETAIKRLKRLGALDENEQITEIGQLLVQFPLDPERAKVLVTADKLEVLAEAVVVTAVLEAEGIFHPPKRDTLSVEVDEPMAREILRSVVKRDRSYGGPTPRWEWEKAYEKRTADEVDLDDLPEWCVRKGNIFEMDCGHYGFPFRGGAKELADRYRREWAGKSKSDFVAIVRAYRAFKTEERRLRGEGNRRELSAWCFRHFLNEKRLRMAENVMHQIREELGSSPLRLENGIATEREFNPVALTKALASGLTDNVARTGGIGSEYTGPLGEFELAFQSACPKGTPLVLVGGVHKIPVRGRRGGTSFMHLADLAAPVESKWLREVMPQLCTAKRQGNHNYDPAQDLVVETEVSYFTETEVGRDSIESADASAAASTFAGWLAGEMI